jgi:hypothetical protein
LVFWSEVCFRTSFPENGKRAPNPFGFEALGF